MNSTHPTLRTASYNIRKCVGLDRRRNPERILSVISGVEADVMVLQEADRRLGDRPATLDRARIAEVTGLGVVEVEGGVSLGWHGNAILTRRDIEVTRISRVDLPGLEPRGALMVELRRERVALRVVATHLGLARRHRRRQLAHLVEEVVGTGQDMPTVILGDFNEWSATRGMEPLHPHYTVFTPGRSFHAARPVAALDRIAIGPGIDVMGGGVLKTGAARIASDHLPVWADLAIEA